METPDPEGLRRAYEPLVGALAREVHSQLEQAQGGKSDINALVCAGRDGLQEAITHVHTSPQDVAFDLLAAYRIRRALLHYVRATAPLVALPWIERAQWVEADRVREQLRQRLAAEPTAAQLAVALGIPVEEVIGLANWQEELVKEHEPLVQSKVWQAIRTTGYRGDRADLQQAGRMRLVEVAQEFDPTLGVPFKPLATKHIHWAMLDESRAAPLLRGPRDRLAAARRDQLAKFTRVREQLRQRLGPEPTAAQLAVALGISVEEVAELEKLESKRKPQPLKRAPMEEVEQVAAESTPEEAALRQERQTQKRALVQDLHECIRTLPFELMVTFILRDLGRLPREVVAQRLELQDLQQVSCLLQQARQQVRTCLHQKGWNMEEMEGMDGLRGTDMSEGT